MAMDADAWITHLSALRLRCLFFFRLSAAFRISNTLFWVLSVPCTAPELALADEQDSSSLRKSFCCDCRVFACSTEPPRTTSSKAKLDVWRPEEAAADEAEEEAQEAPPEGGKAAGRDPGATAGRGLHRMPRAPQSTSMVLGNP